MEFEEFARLMRSAIGGASNTHAFAKTLFDAIITEDGLSVLEEISEETYKAYFNGYTGISRIARKISPFIEPEEFIEYCNQFPDATMISLCDSFRPYLPEITPHNAGELLAGLFQEIIKNAASVKRKRTTKSAKQAKQVQREKIRKTMESTDAEVVEKSTSLTEQLLDEPQDRSETVEAEVVDDEEPSGAATEDKKITVIQQQINVIQSGENNFNLTNNGTMNFNF